MTQPRDPRPPQTGARQTVPLDPQNERMRQAKNLTGTLDALVRSLQLQSAAAEGLAQRIGEAARQLPGLTLQVEASGILLDGETVLPASHDTGKWILPAWYAGLRGLTPLADVRAEDWRTLATGLAQAAPGAEAVDRLSSWLWSGPCEGLRLDLRASAVERIEAVTGDPNAARAALRTAWLDAGTAALHGVDPFATRTPETFARERAWWQRVTAGELTLTPADLATLRQEADEPAQIFRLELMLAMGQEAWQQVLTPPLVARQLTRFAAATYDRDLHSLSGLLSSDEGDWGRICVAELANFPVGEALAEATPLHPQMKTDELQRLQSLLNNQTEAIAAEMLRGLLNRLAQDPDALMPVMAQLMAMLGAPQFLKLASPSKLSPPSRALLGRLVLAAVTSPEELSAVCGSLPVVTFLEILKATPVNALDPLIPALGDAILAADPRERTAVVLHLTDPARVEQLPPAALQVLGDALVKTGGTGWELRTVRLVAETTLRAGLPGEALLEMMRSAKVPGEIRISLLESLARSPKYAAEALKWRMGEMFDAPELRDRLVELRKQRQG